MIPVGEVDGCQIFAHPLCVAMDDEAATSVPPVAPIPAVTKFLLVGPVDTAAERDDLTALGFDLAEELLMPVTVATSMHGHDVTEFEAVLIYGDVTKAVTAAVIWAEALEAGVPTYDVDDRLNLCAVCNRNQHLGTPDEDGDVVCVLCEGGGFNCAWCSEDDDRPEPYYEAGTWFVFCPPCLEGHRVAGKI
ncbi:hypothetical protein OG754_26740 [Streptomyces decoyicus]|uniref:hypothetical protein n=1 Tax=Streptomyces decoyicus TaxID=249567 RepID=UPI002E36AA91|nr:hypothetical protein [Streptomyces decoyicus]